MATGVTRRPAPPEGRGRREARNDTHGGGSAEAVSPGSPSALCLASVDAAAVEKQSDDFFGSHGLAGEQSRVADGERQRAKLSRGVDRIRAQLLVGSFEDVRQRG